MGTPLDMVQINRVEFLIFMSEKFQEITVLSKDIILWLGKVTSYTE